MREISTKKIEIGEHALIDGVEYMAEEGSCCDCEFGDSASCPSMFCSVGGKFTKVEKPTEEEDKDTPMTNLQLAEWLAKGNGQYKHIPSNYGIVYHDYRNIEDTEGWFVADSIVIRPWGTDEWIKPTVGIYERDCGK